MDNEFWEDIYQRCDNGENGHLAVYQGIPCLITRAEERDWNHVNPGRLDDKALFLAYLADGKPAHRETAIPATYTGKVEAAVKALYLKKINKASGGLQKRGQAEKHIDSCLKARDIKKIKSTLTAVGVDLIYEEMDTHYTEGAMTESLYFMKNGQTLTAEARENYEYRLSPLVENWLDNNGFCLETPFGYQGIFYDEESPELDSGGEIGTRIKTTIEQALRKTKGRFRVEVPFAQRFANDEFGVSFWDVKFSPRKKVVLLCSTAKAAQKIADSYPAGSVKVIDQQKERGR